MLCSGWRGAKGQAWGEAEGDGGGTGRDGEGRGGAGRGAGRTRGGQGPNNARGGCDRAHANLRRPAGGPIQFLSASAAGRRRSPGASIATSQSRRVFAPFGASSLSVSSRRSAPRGNNIAPPMRRELCRRSAPYGCEVAASSDRECVRTNSCRPAGGPQQCQSGGRAGGRGAQVFA